MSLQRIIYVISSGDVIVENGDIVSSVDEHLNSQVQVNILHRVRAFQADCVLLTQCNAKHDLVVVSGVELVLTLQVYTLLRVVAHAKLFGVLRLLVDALYFRDVDLDLGLVGLLGD